MDGELCGAALRHPESGLQLALRRDPARAVGLARFDTPCIAVGTRRDLERAWTDWTSGASTTDHPSPDAAATPSTSRTPTDISSASTPSEHPQRTLP